MKLAKKGISFSIGTLVGVVSMLSYQELSKEIHPQAFPTLERQGYSLSYDTRSKIPFWTHERLTRNSLAKNADRKGMEFQEDGEIYPLHRSALIDYSKSGFDRGHIVPAADARFSEEALTETFYLSNICPQHPQFNRGIWRKLETHVRSLVQEHGSIEVVSGPLFLSHEEEGKRFVTYQVIGPNEVAVPTHFFKVIQAGNHTWAYVLPNAPVDDALDTYRFPIDQLEKLSGICFFEKALTILSPQ